MTIIQTSDTDLRQISEAEIRRAIETVVRDYIRNDLHTESRNGFWKVKGTEAVDVMIREAVSHEVKVMIAPQLDKIVKKAIMNTAISIRNNSKYAVIREMVAEAIAEQEVEHD